MPYLDHAATTPMLPEAIDAMSEAMVDIGNASSLHGSGRRARRRVEEARELLGAGFGARPSEIVFTSGGTESDNLAVKGLFWARRNADPRRRRILASTVEHHAVLDTVEWLDATGQADVTWLSVDSRGLVDPDAVRAELSRHADSVALISVMWANNEVGTVQPVAELADIAHEYGVPLHTDAVQAIGAVPVNFGHSGADAMTVTAHKLGGPYGVGALLLRRDAECVPLLHGGGQERDLRSGTLDPPGTTGFAVAASAAVSLDQRNSDGRPGRHRQWTSNRTVARNRSSELSRLRRRFVAHAAGRSRDRVFDRIGVLGRGRSPVARPDRDGRQSDQRARLLAILARSHLDRG
jgi:cysteine desulfurase